LPVRRACRSLGAYIYARPYEEVEVLRDSLLRGKAEFEIIAVIVVTRSAAKFQVFHCRGIVIHHSWDGNCGHVARVSVCQATIAVEWLSQFPVYCLGGTMMLVSWTSIRPELQRFWSSSMMASTFSFVSMKSIRIGR
jgi:hypothetical protein